MQISDFTDIFKSADNLFETGVNYYNNGQFQQAVQYYEKSANKGNPNAQNNLGVCYYYGQGVPQDYKKAVWYFYDSAKQGNPVAQNNMGECFEKGHGVTIDNNKAVSYYLAAAKQGYADAQYNMGNCYEKGIGVEPNYKEAVEWYSKAATNGHAIAQRNLGGIYHFGYWGITVNYRLAFKWYSESAKSGCADSQYALGFYYQIGFVDKDYDKAVYWYTQAATQGHPDAMYQLGQLYMKGMGVQQNIQRARDYWKNAAKMGNKQAIRRISKNKVFIAHSCNQNLQKWWELKEFLKQCNYDVFEDPDAHTNNDMSYCIDHINNSDLIIVLVGDQYPFDRVAGVFYHEMKHLSAGIPRDKVLYICSYGSVDPLDQAVKEFPDQTHLRRLLRVKTHNFNCADMGRLAEMIDNAYMSIP